MCAKHTSRRGFLGTVGAIGATVGLPTVLGKGDELTFVEKIDRANRIRQEHNSRDAWKEYLRTRGVTGSSDQYTLGGNEGPSIQQYNNEDEIDVEINLTFDVDNSTERTYYAELNWHYHWGGSKPDTTPGWGNQGRVAKSYGQKPRDLAALAFKYEDWEPVCEYRADTPYSTSRHVEWEGNKGEGVLFGMHDCAANERAGYVDDDGFKYDTIPPEEQFHAGAFLKPKNNKEDRDIWGDYAHHWGGLGLKKEAGVSYPAGVDVGLKYRTHQMKITSPNGSEGPLLVYESDAQRDDGWGPR